ncbi:MAG: ATP-binding cassette domain-containing protein [Candidatus Cloacimonetes bacterium]|nr:ATP-binding cassette domain-containing protein [Candidatus Cloacimonadota bacterium]
MLRIERMSFAWAGSKELFTEINLTIQPGESVLITGDNGMGKTTLLSLLAGLLKPNQGSITKNGIELHLQKQNVLDGIIHIRQKAEDNLIGVTPKQELRIWQLAYPQLFTNRNIEDLLHINGLQVLRDHATASLSSGELRRLALAPLALMAHRLWLLDEPLSGLDLEYREFYRALIKNKISKSGNVIISSHDESAVDGCGLDRKWLITNNYIKEVTT